MQESHHLGRDSESVGKGDFLANLAHASSIGHFEAANLLGEGPGKRTLFVSEQFALKKIKWNGLQGFAEAGIRIYR